MKKNKPSSSNQLRIIGGEFRSRKLTFSDAHDLRPTGNRIRETLFNWLAPNISGARCLDLFAGSGALGIEALSRGANHCTFVDSSRLACDNISANLDQLNPNLRSSLKACVLCADSHAWLQTECSTKKSAPQTPFDIIFLDPPFATTSLHAITTQLDNSGLLSDHCLIYLEQALNAPPHTLPTQWQKVKMKEAGNVRFMLVNRSNQPI